VRHAHVRHPSPTVELSARGLWKRRMDRRCLCLLDRVACLFVCRIELCSVGSLLVP
jgi:hypothetical protein